MTTFDLIDELKASLCDAATTLEEAATVLTASGFIGLGGIVRAAAERSRAASARELADDEDHLEAIEANK